MSISTKTFGTTKNGEEVTMYTMKNQEGMTVTLLDFGAIIVNVLAPDGKGECKDVVLGYEDLASYEEKNAPGFGSFIGRHANRIGGAQFTLNGETYLLEKNDGDNNLHGGNPGYNKLMYQAECIQEEDSDSVVFSRTSPDMEQGFPGNLEISVTYQLTNENELVIQYDAVSDKDTLVNLTNHTYFNLAGHNAGSILDHSVVIKSNSFTPTADDLIPTGEFVDVTGTPMDFRTSKTIGKEIGADYKPLIQAGGYDHNYVLDKEDGEIEYVGELVDERSGRKMEIYTDLMGMQFYTGNFIMGENGKEGAFYQKRDGVCFETQYFPNSCNIPEFTSCALAAGEPYQNITIYKFTTV